MDDNGHQLESIADQGGLVDRIEYHVEQSRGDVGKGHQELVKAREYQSKARKVHIHI